MSDVDMIDLDGTTPSETSPPEPTKDVEAEYLARLSEPTEKEKEAEVVVDVAAAVFAGAGIASLTLLAKRLRERAKAYRPVRVPRSAKVIGAEPGAWKVRQGGRARRTESGDLIATCAECQQELNMRKQGKAEAGAAPVFDITKGLIHVLSRHMANRSLFKCTECPFATGQRPAVKSHIKSAHAGQAMHSMPSEEVRREIHGRVMSAFVSVRLDLIFHKLDRFETLDPRIQKLFA